MLVILTTTYSEKVPVMVRSKIIEYVMGMMTKGELMRATATWKQAHFSTVMSGSLQLPCKNSKEDGGVGKEANPSPSSDPTASRGFCLDDVQGHVHTTQKVTIPPFGTVSIHGNMGVWGQCMWVHMLAEWAWGPQLPASVVPMGSCTQGPLKYHLPEEPECLPHKSPCQGHCWQGHSCQSGSTSGLPNGGLRRVQSWPTEVMYPGSIESPGPKEVAPKQNKYSPGSCYSNGSTYCPQWHGPGQDILDQALDQVDRSDVFQERLPLYTPTYIGWCEGPSPGKCWNLVPSGSCTVHGLVQ